MNCGIDDDGNPVSQPFSDLKSLLAWVPPHFQECASGKCQSQDNDCQTFRHSRQAPNDPKVLVCHDMAGGYLNDRFIQGYSGQGDSYLFHHWQMIDTFIYFSHQFVTIPPLGWILAAHKNGVDILGTIITEWDAGASLCKQMLESSASVDNATTKLANIAAFFGFDGWLINIENKIEPNQIPLLQTFVKQLTEKCHSLLQFGTVLWYDSVIVTGELKWQDELNTNNEMFFDVCDGIFLNYCITKEKLSRSREKALPSGRQRDVYVGLDVFGRGTPGGGGFNIRMVVEMILSEGLSCAFFAPGWVMEHLGAENFQENNIMFWGILSDLLETGTRSTPLPFSTSFCQGKGKKYFLHGEVISDVPWYNLGLQQVQPSFTQSQFISYHIVKKQKPIVSSLGEDEGNKENCGHSLKNENTDIKCENNRVLSAADTANEKTTSTKFAEENKSFGADDSEIEGSNTIDIEETKHPPENENETEIEVICEKKEVATNPRISLDYSCGYNGGGCLCLKALSSPCQPVVFKLMNLSGIEKLKQLCVTWKLEPNSHTHFLLMLSPALKEASLENAKLIFETDISATVADLLYEKTLQSISRIVPEHPHEAAVHGSWVRSKHDISSGNFKLFENGSAGDMTLSAVLVPCNSLNSSPGLSESDTNQSMCMWIGEIQALTENPSSQETKSPVAANLCCLEVKAGPKLSFTDLEQMVMNNCFKDNHPLCSSLHIIKPESSTTDCAQVMNKNIFPRVSDEESKSSLLLNGKQHLCELFPAMFKKLDLTSAELDGSDAYCIMYYLLKWDLVPGSNVDHFLVYLGADSEVKTFLGFASSSHFVYCSKNEVKNMSFFIQPVILV